MKLARATLHAAQGGIVLRLVDESGQIGQGEASPLAGYSPETREQAFQALAAIQVEAFPPFDLARPVIPQVQDLLEALPPRVPSARFALETALLDLVGQRMGLGLAWLLSAGMPCAAVPLSLLLPGDDSAVKKAKLALQAGIQTVKLKVGRDLAGELALLERLRREVDPRLRIRLDANQSLPPGQAGLWLQAFAAFSPELIEEPVPFALLWDLADSPIPLALDESLQQPEVVFALAEILGRGLIRTLVLKPMALGGALSCLALGEVARSRGVDLLVTHQMDGPIALAAAAALALAIRTESACGLAPHAGLRDWPEIAMPFLGPDRIVLTDRPGLGLDELRMG